MTMAYQSDFHNKRTPAPSQERRDFLRDQLDQRIRESKAAGYDRADFNYLLEPLNKEVADTVKNVNRHANSKHATSDRKKIAKAAREGKALYSATPSTCFSEAVWQDGIATLSFANKTQMTIDVPMALDEWLDFCTGSMGQNWNADYYGEGV